MRVEFKPHAAGLPALRPLRPDRERQRRRRRGQRRRRLGDDRRLDRSSGARRSDPVTATNAANRDYAQPVYAALDGSFSEATSGFVGARERRARPARRLARADRDLRRRGRTATSSRPRASRSRRRQDRARARVRRLAGGRGRQRPRARSAPTSARRSPSTGRAGSDYDQLAEQAARREAARASSGKTASELEDAYYLSANVIKASEDKTFPGAIVASLASPWGQAVSAGDPANTYFGSYREVFARDLYESWTGLVAAGDLDDRARRDALPVRAAAAARRVDAAQQPRQRQGRARLVRDAARRGARTRS